MGNFDWTIWGKKLLKGIGITCIAAAIIFGADYIQVTEFPVEYAFWAGLTYTVLSQIGNWIKHEYLV